MVKEKAFIVDVWERTAIVTWKGPGWIWLTKYRLGYEVSEKSERSKQKPWARSEGLGGKRGYEIQRQVYIGKGSESQGLERFGVGVLGEKCRGDTCILWYVK